MSLITWLPLISDTHNQGISNPTITTNGTALTYTAGKLGTAATFSNSGIKITPAPLNTNTTSFSFAFWFYTTSASAPQCLYNGRTTTGGAIGIFTISGKWRFDDGSQHTFNQNVVANTWQHIVITRDPSNIKLYIDGDLKQTVTSTAFTVAPPTASIGMSSSNGSTPSGNSIKGQLQDYRIYDHVLSVKEIKELAKGLVMHLPLDWGDSTRNPDSSSENYTALDFGTKYLTDCSGFNNPVSAIRSNNTSCSDSPRYLSGTTCGASSCINLGKVIKLQPPFSFAFWFNTSNLSYDSNRLISCTHGGGWNIEEDTSNHKLDFIVYASGSYRKCHSSTLVSNLINNWHHMVCIYDGLKSQMYIDGALENEVIHFSTLTQVTYVSNSVFLGAEATTSETTPERTYSTPTSFSDFRFYATALTAEDVQQVYKIPFSIDSTGKFYGYNLVEV